MLKRALTNVNTVVIIQLYQLRSVDGHCSFAAPICDADPISFNLPAVFPALIFALRILTMMLKRPRTNTTNGNHFTVPGTVKVSPLFLRFLHRFVIRMVSL